MLKQLASVGLVLLLATNVQPCGITTHLEVASRARSFFDFRTGEVDYGALLLSHDDAFQASTSYPDAFYNGLCQGGQFHSLAEDTHWTPFMEVAVNYIRDTYPRPWTKDAEKLVVFLLGIVSHQVSDATWHSLGIDQGYLTAMAGVNFHGSFGAAHSHGDFGGDVVNQYELQTDWIGTLLKWYVPTEDLVNIYERYYGEKVLTEEEIIACHNWMFLGRLGEQLGVIELMTPLYISRSPFLGDRLQDYFLAGVDDMATWVGNVWNHTATMLEYGTEVCDLPRNPIYITCQTRSPRSRRDLPEGQKVMPRTAMHHFEALTKMAASYSRDVIIDKEGKGYSIRLSERLIDLVRQNHAAMEQGQLAADSFNISNNFTIESDQLYSRFGQSVLYADLNGDGLDDLIIGAPGYSSPGNYQRGRVYIYYGTLGRNGDLESQADVIIGGPGLNSRFGWSITTLDFNADGFLDLAVGAPSTGSASLTYNGAVYIYFGSSGGNLISEVGAAISCTQTYCNLGWSLASNDLNGDDIPDLVVGAPYAPSGGKQRGLVGVLFSKQREELSAFDETDFDWVHAGDHDYAWVGFDVFSKGQWLAFGSPQQRICARPDCSFSNEDIQAVGKVLVFGVPISSTPRFQFWGENEFDQFGNSVRLNSDGTLMAVGSPTQGNSDQPGSVRIYNLEDDGQEMILLRGETPLSRFGSSIEFVDLNADGTEDVAVGVPFWSTGISTAQTGQVLGFYMDVKENNISLNEIKETEADIKLTSGESKSRFGWSLASSNQKTLAVSSPFSDTETALGGKMTVFQI